MSGAPSGDAQAPSPAAAGDDTISAYLNEVSFVMGGSFAEQQAVRDELRAHLRDAAREHELAGMGTRDALAAAMRDLGHPAAVGRDMRSSRGTAAVRRPLAQPDGALVLEPRRVRHLPPLVVFLGLAALAASSIALAIAYAWP
jgi:hypothetical protein